MVLESLPNLGRPNGLWGGLGRPKGPWGDLPPLGRPLVTHVRVPVDLGDRLAVVEQSVPEGQYRYSTFLGQKRSRLRKAGETPVRTS